MIDIENMSPLNLNYYISTQLEPRRADPAWQAAHDVAYDQAARIWPTTAAHREREIFAHLAADLAMAAKSVGSAPPEPALAARPTPASKPARARRETVAAIHQRRAIEQRKTMACIAAMPSTGNSLASVLASVEPDNAPASAGEVGFAPLPANPATRAKSGWTKAFAAAEKERIG